MHTHVQQSIRFVTRWTFKAIANRWDEFLRGGRRPCLPTSNLGRQGRLPPLVGAFIVSLATLTSHSADNAKASATLAPEAGRLVVDVHGVPPPAPVFFSATVEHAVRLGLAEIVGEARVRLRVVQGKPEVLTLGL